MKLIFFLVSAFWLNMACENNESASRQETTMKMDTLKRPASVSQNATLINFGSSDEPIPVWAEYIGPLSVSGKQYAHIAGIKYHYVKANQTETVYYENMQLRDGSRSFDFKNSKVGNVPGRTEALLISGRDSLWLFYVLETDEFNREHKGIQFTRMPTIRIDATNYPLPDDLIEYNLKQENETQYTLTLTDGSKVSYKLSSGCKEKPEKLSYLNKQTGVIYFINKDCYLEIVNKDDLAKLKR
jgi:hypothetical protein